MKGVFLPIMLVAAVGVVAFNDEVRRFVVCSLLRLFPSEMLEAVRMCA